MPIERFRAEHVLSSVNQWTASPHALPVDRTRHRQAGRLTNSQAKCVAGRQRIVPGRFENRSWLVTCTCSRSAPLHAIPPPVMASRCGQAVDWSTLEKRGTLPHGESPFSLGRSVCFVQRRFRSAAATTTGRGSGVARLGAADRDMDRRPMPRSARIPTEKFAVPYPSEIVRCCGWRALSRHLEALAPAFIPASRMLGLHNAAG